MTEITIKDLRELCTISYILDYIRNSPPAPGYDSVSIPGDRSARTLKETLKRGTIDVADKTLEKIKELAS